MKLQEIIDRGFTLNAVPRIDMRPRRIVEVRLSDDQGHVSLLCSEEAYEQRLEIMIDTLMVRFHSEVAPIPNFGRGDIRIVDFFG